MVLALATRAVGDVSREWPTDDRVRFSGGLFLGNIKTIDNQGETKSVSNVAEINYPGKFELYPVLEDQHKSVNRNESIKFEDNKKEEVELGYKMGCSGWLKGSPRL